MHSDDTYLKSKPLMSIYKRLKQCPLAMGIKLIGKEIADYIDRYKDVILVKHELERKSSNGE